MSGMQVCLELTEQELHILLFYPETSQGKLVNLNQVRFDSRPIPGGWLEQGQVRGQTLTELLNDFRVVHKIPVNTPTRLAIPLVNGFIREYQLPWIALRHREAAIQYLTKEETPIPQNNQVIGYTVSEENKKSNVMMVSLGGTRRSTLESILQALRGAGFQPTTVEFSVTALGNALTLKPQERYLYLSETRGGIQIILYRGILPELTRFFPVLPGSDPEEWITEITRIFGLMDSEEHICRIFTWGRSSAHIAQRLLKVEFPGLDQTTEISPIKQLAEKWPWRESLPQQVLPCLPCLGLALESGSQGKNQNVNLLSEYLEQGRKEQRKRIALGIVLGFLLSGFGIWFQEKQQLEVLGDEVDGLKTRTVSLQTQEQNETQLVNAWKEVKGAKLGISAPLISLQGLLSEGLSFEQLEYKEETLTLQGTAERADQIEQFLRELQSQTWGNVSLREYRQEKPALINFTVTAIRLKS
ncbi:PilN domain-containing protein [Desulfitobacterium sp.]|uniref:PilN domain-containing protein n=1 Tax=Desulfitobacterium sp. TaxID=49981 RepID=UPI002D011F41|nr:PilN domain-containing protein [Desulfitobacterium sp.]HVJ48900.1 PilN domain-containing protein [Desulfitobacterium sp.]